MLNKLKNVINVGAPTKKQIQHDAWLTLVAFGGSFFAAWQIQPNKLSKAAVVASVGAGVAAAVTVLKSICTTL